MMWTGNRRHWRTVGTEISGDVLCFLLPALASFALTFCATNACAQAVEAKRVSRRTQDLAQQVQRAAYLSEIRDMTDREVLAVINHKLDLLLAIHRLSGKTND